MKADLNCAWHCFLAKWPWNAWNRESELSTNGHHSLLLLLNAIWPAALSSCNLVFLNLMDCALNYELKSIFSLWSYFVQSLFVTAKERKLKMCFGLPTNLLSVKRDPQVCVKKKRGFRAWTNTRHCGQGHRMTTKRLCQEFSAMQIRSIIVAMFLSCISFIHASPYNQFHGTMLVDIRISSGFSEDSWKYLHHEKNKSHGTNSIVPDKLINGIE